MTPETLIEDLNKRGIRLHVKGEKIVVAPAAKLTEEDCQAIRCHKSTLIVLLAAAHPAAVEPTKPSAPPLAEMQQRAERELDPEVLNQLLLAWAQAALFNWPPCRIFNRNFWPHSAKHPRGLAALLDRGDKVIAVTLHYVKVRKRDGHEQRFWRFDA